MKREDIPVVSAEFISISETLQVEKTEDTLKPLRVSEKYPSGLESMGVYYSPEILEQIDNDNFWQGLPSVGHDHDEIVAMIRSRHAISGILPDPRHNRRTLYKSIHYLRNFRKGGWERDRFQAKGSIPESVGLTVLNRQHVAEKMPKIISSRTISLRNR